jgi:putative hydrolase
MVAPVNEAIAGKLREIADVLEQQQADGFRIAAYRRGADTLETLRQPVEEIVRIEGLPTIFRLLFARPS